jgi:hypothetical protein
MRDVDSKIHAAPFDYFKFLFHSFAAATFATQSSIKQTLFPGSDQVRDVP